MGDRSGSGEGRLYERPEIYESVFPLHDDEIAFWRNVAAQNSSDKIGLLLDLGSGPSRLGELLAGAARAVSLDIDPTMLRTAQQRLGVRGNLLQVPLPRRSVGVAISRLFGCSYAVADDPDNRLKQLARELRRVMMPGGVLALEIPLAWRPRRCCWLRETASIAPDLEYEFEYGDLLSEHRFGAAIDSMIRVTQQTGQILELDAPLFVFSPDGALQWAKLAGMTDVYFYAAYDIRSRSKLPAEDALRGILSGRFQD